MLYLLAESDFCQAGVEDFCLITMVRAKLA